MLRLLSSGSYLFESFSNPPFIKALQVFTHATYSTICLAQPKAEKEDPVEKPNNATEVLSKWGCSDGELMRIFTRCPALRNADATKIQSKLDLLSAFGIGASDLVKIVNCRPRFFQSRINQSFNERLAYFLSLFETKDLLTKAIVRNPSLLVYDGRVDIEATFALYEELGIKKRDLIQMILLRPTIISRTSFNDDKMEYIRRIGLSKDSKMYKYVVTLIGVSRVETIRDKVANLEKFGLSEDEVFWLLGKSPHILTLSTDKVQRNMTFILATMKLDVKAILRCPLLLCINIDTVLKPRVLLAMKVHEIDGEQKIRRPPILRALRMTEEKFVNLFIKCHQEEVANELMEFYRRTKNVKRLAESSKKSVRKGFPF
ncbi:hypothetical protein HN51_027387 [Arachis hypogaea]|uniref:Uncharacterized protein n=1 Tax=Arachis hypogaea TaxID=3818 RepID=A0A445BNB9_ARAHY|nr:uncharacterized protein LOC112710291 [Arachis hypogaea]QHO33722.1 uncharacterized protein DS421_9g260720 [Arachis hypogaea]RYR40152.1 hypothetical protein Ahy_A09g045835 [Arachis hypogaea]